MNATNPHKLRDSIVASLGLTGLAVYILACTASFSPDDSKVLFPGFDPQSGQLSVALHDRTAGTTENILVIGPPDKQAVFVARWLPDGRRAVAVWPAPEEQKNLRVAVLPLQSREPTRFFTLPVEKQDEALLGLICPPVVIGRHLYLGGEEVHRLDLVTGEVRKTALAKTEPKHEGIYLLSQADQIYYFREPADANVELELGKLDPETLAFSPLLKLDNAAVGNIEGIVSVSRDGARFAVPRKEAGVCELVIYRGREREKTLRLMSGEEYAALGNTEWSPDGKTLYTAYIAKKGDAKVRECGVQETPLAGGEPRRIPLFPHTGDVENELAHQLALSHDGKTIAVASTFLAASSEEGVKPEDLALYLVDLTSPARKVTKVPIRRPAPGAPASSAK